MYIVMYLTNNSMYIVSCVMLMLCCDNGVQVLISKSILLILMVRRLSCRYGTLLVVNASDKSLINTIGVPWWVVHVWICVHMCLVSSILLLCHQGIMLVYDVIYVKPFDNIRDWIRDIEKVIYNNLLIYNQFVSTSLHLGSFFFH